MILVVGGLGAGKRAYAERELGVPAGAFVDAAHWRGGEGTPALPGAAVMRAEELVRTCSAEAAAALLSDARVVLLAEVGSGVVPIDAAERAWRERAGRLGCLLAARAESVVRVVCGIPQVIAGKEPRALPRSQAAALVPAGVSPRALRVFLVRHGATAGTAARRYCGAGTDEPLSPEGRLALAAVPPAFGVARVWTSGMRRCAETAALLFPGTPQRSLADLREMAFGAFEGKSFADLEHDPAYRAWVEAGCEAACPGGEDRAAFSARCCAAFSRAMAQETAVGAPFACLVVHAGTIRALLSRLARHAQGYFDVSTLPGGAWVGTWDGTALTELRALDAAGLVAEVGALTKEAAPSALATAEEGIA